MIVMVSQALSWMGGHGAKVSRQLFGTIASADAAGLGEAKFIKSGQVTVIPRSPNHKTICVLAPCTITFETGNIIYVNTHNSKISQNVHVNPH